MAFLIGDILGRFTSFEDTWAVDSVEHVADFGVAVDLPADRQRYEDVVYKKKKFPPLILLFYFYLKQIDN